MIKKEDFLKVCIYQGTTLADIARKLGVSKQTVQQQVMRRKEFGQNYLAEFAEQLGLHYVSAFVDDNGKVIVGGCETLPKKKKIIAKKD